MIKLLFSVISREVRITVTCWWGVGYGLDGKHEGVSRVPGKALFLDLVGGDEDVWLKISHRVMYLFCCVRVLFYSKKGFV